MAICQLGNHGACVSCGGEVRRDKQHQHHFSNRRKPNNAVQCGTCIEIIYRAADLVLVALSNAGVQLDDPNIIETLSGGAIIIGIQGTFDEWLARN